MDRNEPRPSLADLLALRKKLTGGPRHRTRPSLATKHRERVEEATHHAWSAAGMDKPWDHKGRHVDTTTVTQPLWMAS